AARPDRHRRSRRRGRGGTVRVQGRAEARVGAGCAPRRGGERCRGGEQHRQAAAGLAPAATVTGPGRETGPGQLLSGLRAGAVARPGWSRQPWARAVFAWLAAASAGEGAAALAGQGVAAAGLRLGEAIGDQAGQRAGALVRIGPRGIEPYGRDGPAGVPEHGEQAAPALPGGALVAPAAAAPQSPVPAGPARPGARA